MAFQKPATSDTHALAASLNMIWKQDRVLVFIWAGQFLNDNPEKKFYFDKDDKTFFSLYLTGNQYNLFDRHAANLTKEIEEILRLKIEKVKTNSRSIIEIEKADKVFDYSPSIPSKDKEDFKLKMEMENEMIKYALRFLDDNQIDLETTDIIELY